MLTPVKIAPICPPAGRMSPAVVSTLRSPDVVLPVACRSTALVELTSWMPPDVTVIVPFASVVVRTPSKRPELVNGLPALVDERVDIGPAVLAGEDAAVE